MTAPHELWKHAAVATTAAAVALAGYGAKLALGAVDRDDVTELIQTQSPYVQDRGAIRQQLRQQTKALEQLTGKVEQLRIQVAQLNVELKHRP